ncbi:hypothetical protein GKZ68_07720 [Hymenobacter sp. BRD128]|uniref:FEKKY domain-containing protein n=1 Tax=Hymenobacter sp. BRD128 TaxID=2675878 RepID=UPI001564DE7A|nr:hypothetical protein [Hymenobacter sp. BRD128]QKG56528.1 hypothetical protein GKZ68_07720 [Hymenobacter sp. BRD128]
MKAVLILMLVSSPISLFAQGAPTFSLERLPHASYLDFASELDGCEEGKKLAEKDIEEKRPCLLLASGIAPIAYTTDKDFENKFGVHYLENGCTGPATACATAYDARIFQYLTERFGRAWQKKVRKDVLGLAEWKRTK